MKKPNSRWNGDVDDMEIPDEVEKELAVLHKETETALQICLATQTFQVGTYVADDYMYNWRMVK